jgi:energy-coupling factor transporter ATP-binding protein EcfA2
LEIFDLFGYLHHKIDFRSSGPTILSGPNGSGKTHVLKILRALVDFDLAGLYSMPFGWAELSYSDKAKVRVDRIIRAEKPALKLVARTKDGYSGGAIFIDAEELKSWASSDLPPWLSRVQNDAWVDQETGEIFSIEEIQRIHKSKPMWGHPAFRDAAYLRSIALPGKSILIETGRLDVSVRTATSRSRQPVFSFPRNARKAPSVSAIGQYVNTITDQIVEARRQSLSVSQQADRRFAARALDKARATIKESDLRKQYERIVLLHHELHANGLTEETIGVEFPIGRTNPTERRIINLFLEDWEGKLEPLTPIHRKLQALRSIVENKLYGKRLSISGRGEISFSSPKDKDLSVDMLSSGEQHMLALFSMLLFRASPGDLILIDEPELSLHAAWKHGFLDDLDKVSEVVPITVIMSTHSTGIVNGHWEIVEELALPHAE